MASKVTPKFIEHCTTVYKGLDSLAINKPLESGDTARVFAGSYVEVWKSTKIAQNYYSPIKKALERNGAILVLQKGGRGVDTVLVLKGLPEQWEGQGWQGTSDLTTSRNYARLSTEVQEIKKSLGGVNLVKALKEVERRLVAIEKELVKKSKSVKTIPNKE